MGAVYRRGLPRDLRGLYAPGAAATIQAGQPELVRVDGAPYRTLYALLRSGAAGT